MRFAHHAGIDWQPADWSDFPMAMSTEANLWSVFSFALPPGNDRVYRSPNTYHWEDSNPQLGDHKRLLLEVAPEEGDTTLWDRSYCTRDMTP